MICIITYVIDSSKILGCQYVGQFMTFCDVGGKVEIRYSRLSDGKQRKRSHCPTMSRISKWGMELYMTMHDTKNIVKILIFVSFDFQVHTSGSCLSIIPTAGSTVFLSNFEIKSNEALCLFILDQAKSLLLAKNINSTLICANNPYLEQIQRDINL